MVWGFKVRRMIALSCALISFLFILSGLNTSQSSTTNASWHRSAESVRSVQHSTVRLNGTLYVGRPDLPRNLELFLGIPFAEPPLSDLRFLPPQPRGESSNQTVLVTEYGPQCMNYENAYEYPTSEDCLTLNIVRPTTPSLPELLPVAVWIYGGSWDHGGSSDGRYNLSFIVEESVKIGMPFIAVSLNYRASIFGFMAGDHAKGHSIANVGLLDQRMALHWVQENIHAFGGDRTKVTIWGASTGADSIGLHLLAYGGEDHGLFRAAIMQSGGPLGTAFRDGTDRYSAQNALDQLVVMTGCDGASSQFHCLQKIPLDKLEAAFNDSLKFGTERQQVLSRPILDGNMLQAFGSVQLRRGNFIKVPIMSGINTDERSHTIPPLINGPDDVRGFLLGGQAFSTRAVSELIQRYMPFNDSFPRLDNTIIHERSRAFHRLSDLMGDVMASAGHHLTCAMYSAHAPCYSYRLDAPSSGIPKELGTIHGAELGPVFHNFACTGFSACPFLGKSESYYEMSTLMSRMWISFIVNMDPNPGAKTMQRKAREWPVYTKSLPRSFVFREGNGSFVEGSPLRSSHLEWINEVQADLFCR